ncbi:Scaffold protein Nfu/NifU domain protein, partial [Cooperia oncophora]
MTCNAASNEYESLNSLLNSSFAHHQNGDFSISHASSTYPSSPSAVRSLNASRIQSGAGAFAPPPGFGSVVSSQSTSIGGANPAVPPPSLRPYYNAQMPPPAGLPLQPSQHASFATFNSQHSNWMSSGHGKQTGVRSLYIQMQDTPNPLSLKFLPGQAILDEPRTYEFTSVASARDKELFHINGVRSVFLGQDFITVTKKDEETDWALMRAEILSAITNFIESGKPVITEGGSAPAYDDTVITEDDDDTVAMIKELLDSRVRPMVQEDGG